MLRMLLGSTAICRAPEGVDGGGGAGGDGAGAGGAPDAVAQAFTALTQGLDADSRGWLQSKGYKGFGDVIKGGINAEKAIGADKIPLPPRDAKGNRDWSKWDGFKELGRPEAADKYAFKLPDGQQATDTDKAFHAAMAPLLHKAGLAQWQLDILAEGFNGFGSQHRQQMEAAAAQELTASETALKQDPEFGGMAFEKNMDQANRAVRQFLGPEGVALLTKSGLGRHPVLVKAFARIGAAIGEDGTNPGGTGVPGVSTPAGAQEEIQRLKGDKEFQAAFLDKKHPDHQRAMEKMIRLQRMANPQAEAAE